MADQNILDVLPAEDLEQIGKSLRAFREAGNPHPVIPFNVDLDGDGVTDGFGLDDNGDVVFVSGVDIVSTVYRADEDAPTEVD